MRLRRAPTSASLFVGNATYLHALKLPNTLNDARGMRDALNKLGFMVVYAEDLNQHDLNRTIRTFSEAVEGADDALAFFAGHGSTFGGIPYIVPVDAEFTSIAKVTYQLVRVETYIGQLRQVRGIRIAILDACRDNEAETELKRVASRGLAPKSGGRAGINASGLIVSLNPAIFNEITRSALVAAGCPAHSKAIVVTDAVSNATVTLHAVSLKVACNVRLII